MDELIEDYEQRTGNNYTRDEIIYNLLLSSENEDDALGKYGYSAEDIEEIEKEYEEKKKMDKVPDRYLNKTYIVTYPDGAEETVSGQDLLTYKGEYTVDDNKKYQIRIAENGEEKVLSISVKNFVKYPTYEDEYYTYNFDRELKGYEVSVKDKTLSQYGEILENIDGINIVSLHDTFYKCSNLTQAPKIPQSVTDLSSTFLGCKNLIQAPEIPNGTYNMRPHI